MLFNRLKFSNVGVLTAKVRFETSQVLTWSKPIKKPFLSKTRSTANSYLVTKTCRKMADAGRS